MSDVQAGSVVVGIDGSTAASQALDWAAGEAERRGVPLVIAYAGHISHPGALTPDTIQAASREVCEYGRELLADAIATVFENHGSVEASTELRETHPAEMLIEFSESAALVVVGRGNGGLLARFAFGSTTQRVADHAHCAVVVVAEDPLPAAGNVVVGVSASENGRRAMRFACSEASMCGATLVAIRSWPELNWAITGLGNSPDISLESLRIGEQALLDEWVRAAKDEFPGLEIDARLTDVPAEIALEEAAGSAALLVVGCRRPDRPHLPRLGPLTSWLMYHSACPIAMVGQTVAPESDAELEAVDVASAVPQPAQ